MPCCVVEGRGGGDRVPCRGGEGRRVEWMVVVWGVSSFAFLSLVGIRRRRWWWMGSLAAHTRTSTAPQREQSRQAAYESK